MGELEVRIIDEKQEFIEKNSAIEPQLVLKLKHYASNLIVFGTPFNSWLESDEKSTLVFKLSQKFFKFYRFYIWLIIHFGFGFNI